MTTTSTRQRPDTHDMYVVHRVFRREAALMPRLIRSVRPGDTTRSARIAEHFRGYKLGLHHHHTAEDELIWPLMLQRVDLEQELVLRMEEQHERVAGGLETIERLLPRWERTAGDGADDLVAAMEVHKVALFEHLTDEETKLLPLIEEHLTVEEYGALNERFASETPKDMLLFFLGALLEEANAAEEAHIMQNLPLPAKLVWRFYGRRHYARQTRELRGGITPGVV
jgi:hemerythrin-like domain-containing protein